MSNSYIKAREAVNSAVDAHPEILDKFSMPADDVRVKTGAALADPYQGSLEIAPADPPHPSFCDIFVSDLADNLASIGILATRSAFAEDIYNPTSEFGEAVESGLQAEERNLAERDIDRSICFQNEGFLGKAKYLAADLVNPFMVATAAIAGPVFSGLVKGASSIPIIDRLGASIANWSSKTFGNGARYLGYVATGAGEAATFETIRQTGREIADLPAENIGENILINALMGGVLTGAIGAIRRKNWLKELNRQICNPDETFDAHIAKDGNISFARHLSAAAVQEEKVIREAEGAIYEKPKSKWLAWGPIQRTLQSNSPTLRKISELYFGNRFQKTETEGAASVCDLMESNRGKVAEYIVEYNNHLKRYGTEYKRANPNASKREIRDSFNREWLYGAIEGGKTSNQIINGFVSATKQIFASTGREAVELGLLDKSVLGKEYFPQFYDKRRIAANREGWLQALKNGIQVEKAQAKNEIQVEKVALEENLGYASFKEIEDIVRDIDETVYWYKREGISRPDGSSMPSSLKERKVHIDQKFLADYLVSDPVELMNSYITGMGFKIAEAKCLKRLGYKDFSEVKKAFEAEQGKYFDSNEAVEAKTLLDSIPSIVCGQFDAARRRAMDEALGGTWARQALGALQDLNVARYLGGLGLSGAVDLAANLAKGNFCKHISGLIKQHYRDLGGMTKQEMIQAGFGIDSVLGEIRYLARETVLDDPASKIGNLIGKIRENVTTPLANLTIELSGIRLLDSMRERCSAALNCMDVANAILKGETKVGKLEGKKLSKIKEQLEKYKTENDGVTFYNLSSWDNSELRFDFESEVRRRVRGEVFRPNKGDIPNALRGPFPKLFGMFYSFSWGVVNNVITPLWKDGRYGELATLVGASFALEGVNEYIRSFLRGKPYNIDNDEDVEKMFFRALSRSPVLGQLVSGANLVTFGALGESRVHSTADLAAAMVKGGNLSWIFDAFGAINTLGERTIQNRPLNQKDARRIMKCLPLQNWYLIQGIANGFINELPN